VRAEVECPGCSKRFTFHPGQMTGAEPACGDCGRGLDLAVKGWSSEAGSLERCLACGEYRLYRQRDINRKVGLAVVLGGAGVSLALLPFSALAAYLVLFALAGIDLVFYLMLPEVVICYRCGAKYRGFPRGSKIEPFDLLTAEMVDHQVREEKAKEEAGASL
jgi:DNA-directed RNA polymerase subunit RPC12/RpoP